MCILNMDKEEVSYESNTPKLRMLVRRQMIIGIVEIKYKLNASKDHSDFMWSFQGTYLSNLSDLNSHFQTKILCF